MTEAPKVQPAHGSDVSWLPGSTLVYWEDDPSRTRTVVRLCRRCRDYDGQPLDHARDAAIVSPAGTGHLEGENSNTACGIDATGEDWWWRI